MSEKTFRHTKKCEEGRSECLAVTSFRAVVARVTFLASDQPDIAFPVKELCRSMASPTQRDADDLPGACWDDRASSSTFWVHEKQLQTTSDIATRARTTINLRDRFRHESEIKPHLLPPRKKRCPTGVMFFAFPKGVDIIAAF